MDWSFPVNAIHLRIDPLSAFFLLFSIPMTLLGSVYAKGYLAPYLAKGRNAGVHFALLNMVSLSYIIIYTVENAVTFLLGWGAYCSFPRGSLSFGTIEIRKFDLRDLIISFPHTSVF